MEENRIAANNDIISWRHKHKIKQNCNWYNCFHVKSSRKETEIKEKNIFRNED